MARKKIKEPAKVVERNIKLARDVMRYLLNNQRVFSLLPDNFELVILPDDDPEMRLYNLELLDKYGSEDKPIVIARTRTRQKNLRTKAGLNFFVPVPMMA